MIGIRRTIPMRILSWVLTLAMILTLIPVAGLTKVQAAEPTITLKDGGQYSVELSAENPAVQKDLDSYIEELKDTVGGTVGTETVAYSLINSGGANVQMSGSRSAVALFKSAGTVEISVYFTKYPDVKKTMTFTVTDTRPSDATLLLTSTDTAISKVGDSAAFKAVLNPANAYPASQITWSIDDTSVAKVSVVDNVGTVTALAPGTAILTVSLPNGSSQQVTVTVAEPTPTPYIVINNEPESKEILIRITNEQREQTYDLSLISWLSDHSGNVNFAVTEGDPVVGKLQDGHIVKFTGAAGTLKVTVSAEGRPEIQSKEIVFKVQDERTNDATIAVTPASAVKKIGDSDALTATITNADHGLGEYTNAQITWTVDPADTGVLTWNVTEARFEYEVLKSGSVTVTAALPNGASASAVITVSEAPYIAPTEDAADELHVAITKAALNPVVDFSSLYELKNAGEQNKIKAAVVEQPQDGEAVADDAKVTFKAAGTYKIRLTAVDSTVQADPLDVRVIVTDERANESTIKMNESDPLSMEIGDTASIGASIVKDNTAPNEYTAADVTWKSTDPEVVSVVRKDGDDVLATLVAKKAGYAEITAALPNGAYASRQVIVAGLTPTPEAPHLVAIDATAAEITLTLTDAQDSVSIDAADYVKMTDDSPIKAMIVTEQSHGAESTAVTFKQPGQFVVRVESKDNLYVSPMFLYVTVVDERTNKAKIIFNSDVESGKNPLVGDTVTLTATINNSDESTEIYTNDQIAWTVLGDAETAEVSTKNNIASVTGTKAGMVVVVAALPNGESYSVTLTFEAPEEPEAPAELIWVDGDGQVIDIFITDNDETPSVLLTDFVRLSNGGTPAFEKISGDCGEVEGNTASFNQAGMLYVKAYALNSDEEEDLTVAPKFLAFEVTDNRAGNPTISSVVNYGSEDKTELMIGEKADYVVTITNEKDIEPKYYGKDIEWSVSDESIVKLYPVIEETVAGEDADETEENTTTAEIYAVGEGIATVSAKLPNGNITTAVVKVGAKPEPVSVVLESDETAAYDVTITEDEETPEVYLPGLAKLSDGRPASFKPVKGEGMVGDYDEGTGLVTFSEAGVYVVKAYAAKTVSEPTIEPAGGEDAVVEDETVAPVYLIFNVTDERVGNAKITGKLVKKLLCVGDETEFIVEIENDDIGPKFSPAEIVWSSSDESIAKLFVNINENEDIESLSGDGDGDTDTDIIDADSEDKYFTAAAVVKTYGEGLVYLTATLPNGNTTLLWLEVKGDPVISFTENPVELTITDETPDGKVELFLPEVVSITEGNWKFESVTPSENVEMKEEEEVESLYFSKAGVYRVKISGKVGAIKDEETEEVIIPKRTAEDKYLTVVVTDERNGLQKPEIVAADDTVFVGAENGSIGVRVITPDNYPAVYDAQDLTVESSDPSVATLTLSGYEDEDQLARYRINALSSGTVTITAALPNGNTAVTMITIVNVPELTVSEEVVTLEITDDSMNGKAELFLPQYVTISESDIPAYWEAVVVSPEDADFGKIRSNDTEDLNRSFYFDRQGVYRIKIVGVAMQPDDSFQFDEKYMTVIVNDLRQGNQTLKFVGELTAQEGDDPVEVKVKIKGDGVFSAKDISLSNGDASVATLAIKELESTADHMTLLVSPVKAGTTVLSAQLPNGNLAYAAFIVTPAPEPVSVVIEPDAAYVYEKVITFEDENPQAYLPALARLSDGSPATFLPVKGEGTVGDFDEETGLVTFKAAGVYVVKAFAGSYNERPDIDPVLEPISGAGEDITVAPSYLIFNVTDAREGNPVIEGKLSKDVETVGTEVEFTVTVDNDVFEPKYQADQITWTSSDESIARIHAYVNEAEDNDDTDEDAGETGDTGTETETEDIDVDSDANFFTARAIVETLAPGYVYLTASLPNGNSTVVVLKVVAKDEIVIEPNEKYDYEIEINNENTTPQAYLPGLAKLASGKEAAFVTVIGENIVGKYDESNGTVTFSKPGLYVVKAFAMKEDSEEEEEDTTIAPKYLVFHVSDVRENAATIKITEYVEKLTVGDKANFVAEIEADEAEKTYDESEITWSVEDVVEDTAGLHATITSELLTAVANNEEALVLANKQGYALVRASLPNGNSDAVLVEINDYPHLILENDVVTYELTNDEPEAEMFLLEKVVRNDTGILAAPYANLYSGDAEGIEIPNDDLHTKPIVFTKAGVYILTVGDDEDTEITPVTLTVIVTDAREGSPTIKGEVKPVEIQVGEEALFEAMITNALIGPTYTDKDITWASSDDSLVAIYPNVTNELNQGQDGEPSTAPGSAEIVALAAGYVQLTATLPNGNTALVTLKILGNPEVVIEADEKFVYDIEMTDTDKNPTAYLPGLAKLSNGEPAAFEAVKGVTEGVGSYDADKKTVTFQKAGVFLVKAFALNSEGEEDTKIAPKYIVFNVINKLTGSQSLKAEVNPDAIYVGKDAKVVATIIAGADDNNIYKGKDIEWSVSNGERVEIVTSVFDDTTSTAIVTGLEAGNVNLIASLPNGNSAVVALKVMENPYIQLREEAVTLNIERDETETFIYIPSYARIVNGGNVVTLHDQAELVEGDAQYVITDTPKTVKFTGAGIYKLRISADAPDGVEVEDAYLTVIVKDIREGNPVIETVLQPKVVVVGEDATFSATVINGSYGTTFGPGDITWTSSDESIARIFAGTDVSEVGPSGSLRFTVDGRVATYKEGLVLLKAELPNGNLSIAVLEVKAKETPAEVVINGEEFVDFDVEINDDIATPNVYLPSIAKLDNGEDAYYELVEDNGTQAQMIKDNKVITFKAQGTAVVKAYNGQDVSVPAKYIVFHVSDVRENGATISITDPAGSDVEMIVGSTHVFTAAITPDGNGKTYDVEDIEWSVETVEEGSFGLHATNASVLSITPSKNTAEGLAKMAGYAAVTATLPNGKSSTAFVKVVPVPAIELSETVVYRAITNDAEKAEVYIPTYATTNNGETITAKIVEGVGSVDGETYTSSTPGYARILLTANEIEPAYLTVVVLDLRDGVANITGSLMSGEIEVGAETSFLVEIVNDKFGDQYTAKDLTWWSTDESVAKVYNTANATDPLKPYARVEGVGEGYAQLAAALPNGNLAVVAIRVVPKAAINLTDEIVVRDLTNDIEKVEVFVPAYATTNNGNEITSKLIEGVGQVQNNTFTSNEPGTAKIEISAEGAQPVYLTVIVNDLRTGTPTISGSLAKGEIEVGQETAFLVEIANGKYGDQFTTQEITWWSTDESIAKVYGTANATDAIKGYARVEGVGEGYVQLVAALPNGNAVVVALKVLPKAAFEIGDTAVVRVLTDTQPTATVYIPTYVKTNNGVPFKAQIVEGSGTIEGDTFTTMEAGVTLIELTAEGMENGYLLVDVKDIREGNPVIEGKLDQDTVWKGTEVLFTATVNNGSFAPYYTAQDITWTSSDESIAKIYGIVNETEDDDEAETETEDEDTDGEEIETGETEAPGNRNYFTATARIETLGAGYVYLTATLPNGNAAVLVLKVEAPAEAVLVEETFVEVEVEITDEASEPSIYLPTIAKLSDGRDAKYELVEDNGTEADMTDENTISFKAPGNAIVKAWNPGEEAKELSAIYIMFRVSDVRENGATISITDPAGSDVEMTVGTTYVFKAAITPDGNGKTYDVEDIEWSVATVEEGSFGLRAVNASVLSITPSKNTAEGLAKMVGYAAVTATLPNGKSSTAFVKVVPVPEIELTDNVVIRVITNEIDTAEVYIPDYAKTNNETDISASVVEGKGSIVENKFTSNEPGVSKVEVKTDGAEPAFLLIVVIDGRSGNPTIEGTLKEETLYVGEEAFFTVNVKNEKHEPKYTPEDIEWTSSDESVAKVYGRANRVDDGEVTEDGFTASARIETVAPGYAYLTAKLPNGNAAVLVIRVNAVYPPVLTIKDAEIDINMGTEDEVTYELKSNVEVENASIEDVAFATSDDTNAEITNTQITFKQPGTYVVTATVSNDFGAAEGTIIFHVFRDFTDDDYKIEREQDGQIIYLKTGDLYDLKQLTKVTLMDEEVPEYKKNIIWTSSVPAIGEVTDGVVEALAVGNTIVTAALPSGAYVTFPVIVVPVTIDYADGAEKTIVIDENKIGHETTLVDKVVVTNGDLTDVTWTSDNEDVATVNNGVVIAHEAGIAVITAMTVDGYYVTFTIEVKEPTKPTVALFDGKTTVIITDYVENPQTIFNLNENVYDPATHAPTEGFVWTTSDDDIVSVSDGIAVVKAPGTATVRVEAPDGSYVDFLFLVNEGTFESDYTGEPVYLVLGTDQETFDLATLGFSSKSGKITYVSADNSIARVQGSVVKGVAEGRTAIEVTAPNGDVVNVLVYVYELKSHVAGEDELWLTMGEAMSLRDKVTVTVIPTSHPLSDKLDGMADLTWVSSNEGVVTVLDGNIVTTGTGTANVKAIGTDGSEAVFLIHVLPKPVSSVKWSESGEAEVTIYYDGVTTATADVTGYVEATNVDSVADLEWFSDDTNIATVSAGIISAVSLGSTYVTAKAEDGSFVRILVQVKPYGFSEDTATLDDIVLRLGKGGILVKPLPILSSKSGKVNWEISDTDIAVIKGNEVAAVSAGTTVATAYAPNGDSASLRVIVLPAYEMTIAYADNAEKELWLTTGESVSLVDSVTYEYGEFQDLTWTVDDPTILEVVDGVVKTLAQGTAVVKATTPDGYFVVFTIHVTDPTLGNVVLRDGSSSVIIMTYTEDPLARRDLAALVENTKTDDDVKGFAWTSSDKTVVDVAEGFAVANKPGSAYVTVTAPDGTFVKFIVIVNADGIETQPTESEIWLWIDGEPHSYNLTDLGVTSKSGDVVWTVADETIVSLEDTIVTALKDGTTVATATAPNGGTASVVIHVIETLVGVTGGSAIELKMGETETVDLYDQVTVYLDPDNSPVTWTESEMKHMLVWESSNTDVAVVDDGYVVAVGPGTSIVKAKAPNGTNAAFLITVLPKELSNVKWAADASAEVTLGYDIENPETEDVTDRIEVTNGTAQDLVWATQDNSIAIVSAGVITGVGVGKTQVTATAEDGSKVTFFVTVIPYGFNEGKEYDQIVLQLGITDKETALLPVLTSKSGEVTWRSNDESVCVISGNRVEAVAPGDTTIVATAPNGEECAVSVKVLRAPVLRVEYADGVEEDDKFIGLQLEKVETKDLTPLVKVFYAIYKADVDPELDPEQVTDLTRELVWTSEDESIVSVRDGLIYAHKAGRTVIKAAVPDGTSFVTFIVTVTKESKPGVQLREGYDNLVQLILNSPTLSFEDLNKRVEAIFEGEVTAKFNTADFEWTSADPSIAEVHDGMVYARAVGSTTVTVVAPDGSAVNFIVVVAAGGFTDDDPDSYACKYSAVLQLKNITEKDLPINEVKPVAGKINWHTINESVAVVEGDKVVAVGEGRTYVIAEAESGDQLAFPVKVYAAPELSFSETSVATIEGLTTEIGVVSAPKDAKVVYTINGKDALLESDEYAFNANADKFTFIAKKAGEYRVVGSIVYPENVTEIPNPLTATAECVITTDSDVTSLYMDPDSQTIYVGERRDLGETIVWNDGESTPFDTTLEWRSDDESIVTVTQEGRIQGIKAGTAIVYAKAYNGLEAKCFVTVKQRPNGIIVSDDYIELWKTERAYLVATPDPADTSRDEYRVEYESMDESVCTVEIDEANVGVIYAVEGGKTEIKSKIIMNDGWTYEAITTVLVKRVIEEVKIVSDVQHQESEGTVAIEHIGDEAQLKAVIVKPELVANPENGIPLELIESQSWTLEKNNGTLAVDQYGRITALARGSEWVWVRFMNPLNRNAPVSAVIKVVVGEASEDIIDLAIAPNGKKVYPGTEVQLTAEVIPEGYLAGHTVTWSVDTKQPKYVKIDENGLLMIDKNATEEAVYVYGSVKRADGTSLKRKAIIYIKNPVNDIRFADEEIWIYINEYMYLDPIFNGGLLEPYNKKVTYVSEDKTIATIDKYGKLTAKKLGDVFVNAYSYNNLRAQLLVHVISAPTSISITGDKRLTMWTNTKQKISYKILPKDCTENGVVWSTSDKNVAYVKEGILYAKNEGYAKVTVTCINQHFGTISAHIYVTVKSKATGIDIDGSDVSLKVGQMKLLHATVKPATAMNKLVYWSTRNPDIAMVDEMGVITGLKKGTTVVYAVTATGIVARKNVTVSGSSASKDLVGYTTTDHLYVREYESIQAPQLGWIVTPGTKVTIVATSKDGEWYKIKWKNGYGFVRSAFVNAVGRTTEMILRSNAHINEDTLVYIGTPGGTMNTHIPKDTRVLVTGKTGSYYSISYGTNATGKGYVLKSKVTLDKNAKAGVATQVTYLNGGTELPVSSTPQVTTYRVVKTKTRTYLYPEARWTSEKLGHIKKGTRVIINSQLINGYYQVIFTNNTAGFIRADMVTVLNKVVKKNVNKTNTYIPDYT